MRMDQNSGTTGCISEGDIHFSGYLQLKDPNNKQRHTVCVIQGDLAGRKHGFIFFISSFFFFVLPTEVKRSSGKV